MSEKNRTERRNRAATQDEGAYPPFDPTTNFSLLGWLLDRLTTGHRKEEQVDFSLED